MAGSTEYVAFANGVGANRETPSAWAADATRTAGFQNGIANAAQVSTPIAQASTMVAALAKAIADTLAVAVLDDGNVANLEAQLISMITQIAVGSSGGFATAAEILNLNSTKPISGAGLFAAAAFQSLTYGSPIAWDARAKGPNTEVTLTGSTTQLGAISNLSDAEPLIFAPKQDTTGSRMLTYASQHVFLFNGGVPPTLSTAANKQDFMFGFYKASASSVFWTSFAKAA
jgi:hypothetical protein